MKTKITIIALSLISISCISAIFSVDVSTPQVVSGRTIIGDSLPVAFGKINTNFSTVTNDLESVRVIATNAVPMADFSAVTNNLYPFYAATTNNLNNIGSELTNMVLSVGSDLTNRVESIKTTGSSGLETVLKIQSPDGTTWYLHVDNSGVLTQTTSP